jgi:MacB-like periplasmic core domain
MQFWHLITARLRAAVLRRRSETEMDEELRLHLERTIEQRVGAGMPLDEARRISRIEFGGVEQIKEDCRDARGIGVIDNLTHDTRHSLRRLVRDWQFTTAAVLILALGIGANTAIFSAVNTALFREKAFDSDRLVDIYQRTGSGSPGASSYPAYLDMAAYSDIFAATTAVGIDGAVYQGSEGPRTAMVEFTTASYLSVLGLRPSRGRWFDAREDTRGAEVVAVLGYKAWQTRFGSDLSVIGRTIRMNGTPVTIIGIGPEDHNSVVNAGLVTDFWVPITALLAITPALARPPAA